MSTKSQIFVLAGIILASMGVLFLASGAAEAHCDTLDGPVVTDAREALEKKDVTPVLKWVKEDDEREIRQAFAKTLVVRSKGSDARELADSYFFETLVRIHRAGEGAPYTGLKPAGTEVDAGIDAADKALEVGSADHLVKRLTDEVAAGIGERFAKAVETKKHANKSVQAGREYVASYVEFIHYVEGIHLAVEGRTAHHEEAVEVACEQCNIDGGVKK